MMEVLIRLGKLRARSLQITPTNPFKTTSTRSADHTNGDGVEGDESLEEQFGLGRAETEFPSWTVGRGIRGGNDAVAAFSQQSSIPIPLQHEEGTSSPLTESYSRTPRPSTSFKESKFAKVLGFGFFKADTGPPVNMGQFPVEVPLSSEDGQQQQQQQPQQDSASRGHRMSNPIEPSYYLIGMRMADTQWAMNYQEGAIYLEEGANNDQFSTHPKRKESLPAYIMAHTSWFYVLDLLASLVLLSLALTEPPAVDMLELPLGVHASLELGALAVIALGLILKLRWLGISTLFSHKRTLIKTLTMVVMIIEAVAVLLRQSSHVRITRALRPIFLVDNRYCRGVRRFTREVLQTLPPIIDMLLLLFFFILTFTLLGHFLFGHADGTTDPFFKSLDISFVNLFVLLTTANYPDVMMPSYNRSRWSVLFFVAYLVTVLYLFMNLLLAVVYDTFTTLEKEKFRKLVVHKRQACHYSFNLLVSKSNPNGIIFRHFYGMMTQFAPKKSLRDIYLTFKALDKSGDGILSREEFCRFYEFADLKWEPQLKNNSGFQRQWIFCADLGVKAQRFLNSPYADHLFNGVIILNTVAMVARWVQGGYSWDSYVFATWFMIEMGLKIAAWGSERVFSSGWHTFDLIASVLFIFAIIFVEFLKSWSELLTFVRPLRLLRLFKLKKRYRDVFGTLFILIPPMSSAASVILLLYYAYSIVGMELFANIPLRNCCNGTLLEPYYADDGLNTTFQLHYYLNTFSNLAASWVTLFELTVVNNWYVIMEGHAMVTSGWSRLYFMSFYLVTMVLITIIVAFILDTFLFRIQYKRAMDKKTEEKMLRTEVPLTGEEIDFCYRQYADEPTKRAHILQDYGEDLAVKGCVHYVGFRRRTKEILFKRMFKNEIPDWLRETEPVL